MTAKNAQCSATEKPSGFDQPSRSKKMLALAIFSQWLRHNAHVSDASLLDGIHDCCKKAERNVGVGAQIDRLVLGIVQLAPQSLRYGVHIDRIISQINPL